MLGREVDTLRPEVVVLAMAVARASLRTGAEGRERPKVCKDGSKCHDPRGLLGDTLYYSGHGWSRQTRETILGLFSGFGGLVHLTW